MTGQDILLGATGAFAALFSFFAMSAFKRLSTRQIKQGLTSLIEPNRGLPHRAALTIYLAAPLVFVTAWALFSNRILPSPLEVIASIPRLWSHYGLGVELWSSLALNVEAVTILAVLSLALAYATVLPVARPVVKIFSLGRFNGFVGLPIIFTLWLKDPHYVKLGLLVFAASVYAVPSIVSMMNGIEKELFDHARTLRFNEWRVFWEVAVLGRLDEIIDIIGANAAMVWMLVPMVEVLFRFDGGVGALAVDMDKHMDLAAVYGIAVVVSLTGGLQDLCLSVIKGALCPYARLGLERA